MNGINAVLLAVVCSAAGAAGGYMYARHTEAPPVVDETTWNVDKALSAIAEARAMPPGTERTSQLFEAVRRVGWKDERVVIERLPLQNQDGVAQMVRDRLLDRWAMDDPQAAMAYANRLTDSYDRDHAIAIVAKAWVQTDPFAALNAAPPALVYGAWIDMDPVSAVRREYTLPLVDNVHPHNAMTAWVARDPEAAAKWVRENPTLPEAAAYVSVIVATKATDPQKARQWVSELPQGDVRSNAQGALAALIVDKTPNEALRLVSTMAAGPARANAAADVISALNRSDREDVAEEWLDESPLNAEERKLMSQRMATLRAAR